MQPRRRFAYGDVGALVASLTYLLRPPADLLPSQAAEKWRQLHNPGGGYSGAWRNSFAPYLVDPMDSPSNPWVRTTVFVGPSQCGKTEIPLNWVHHSIMVDPADMMFVLEEKDQADDFSDRRVVRMHDHSEALKQRVIKERRYLMTYQGMTLAILWATGSKAASKPIPRVAMTERDRMPDDLDGEGDPVELFRKRTQSFGNSARMLVESSPRRDVIANAPKPGDPHQAPEVEGGILRLYNTGTRKRWYWPCPHCAEFFIPDWEVLEFPADARSADIDLPIKLACPHCGTLIDEREKADLNQRGRWVAMGQRIDAEGRIYGAGPRTDVDSYWFSGVASAFLPWNDLVRRHLIAKEEQAATGSTEKLRTWTNTDLGRPFERPSDEGEQLDAQVLKSRAVTGLVRGVVPEWVRFLQASVDVQLTSFKVLIRGFGPGLESTIVDYFPIFRDSDREDAGPISPATRAEHWDLLRPKVIERLYPLAADPGRAMRIMSTAIDLQGASGVTTQAYAFARRCRSAGIGDDRVMLVRGGNKPGAALITPQAIDKDAKGRPLKGSLLRYTLNVDQFKDQTVAQLRRLERGPDFIHLPAWLSDEEFGELAAERKVEGKWHKLGANELFDLMGYAQANAVRLQALRIDWGNPPAGAAPQDRNSLVVNLADAAIRAATSPPAPVGRTRGIRGQVSG